MRKSDAGGWGTVKGSRRPSCLKLEARRAQKLHALLGGKEMRLRIHICHYCPLDPGYALVV